MVLLYFLVQQSTFAILGGAVVDIALQLFEHTHTPRVLQYCAGVCVAIDVHIPLRFEKSREPTAVLLCCKHSRLQSLEDVLVYQG